MQRPQEEVLWMTESLVYTFSSLSLSFCFSYHLVDCSQGCWRCQDRLVMQNISNSLQPSPLWVSERSTEPKVTLLLICFFFFRFRIILFLFLFFFFNEDLFVIVACDGVFDVFSDADVCNLVLKRFKALRKRYIYFLSISFVIFSYWFFSFFFSHGSSPLFTDPSQLANALASVVVAEAIANRSDDNVSCAVILL